MLPTPLEQPTLDHGRLGGLWVGFFTRGRFALQQEEAKKGACLPRGLGCLATAGHFPLQRDSKRPPNSTGAAEDTLAY